MDPRIEEVLSFWFGTDPNPGAAELRRWFSHDPQFDAEVRERFAALHAEAAAGKLDSWTSTPRGALALIIVLDQLSRNIYRDDARAYDQDAKALALALELLAGGASDLASHERVFAILPLQHSEDVLVQRKAVCEFEALAARGRGDPLLTSGLDFARRHAAIIERFGRFPHRNAILGRTSTPEEVEFLAEPGSRF